jgi:hypothetical protein
MWVVEIERGGIAENLHSTSLSFCVWLEQMSFLSFSVEQLEMGRARLGFKIGLDEFVLFQIEFHHPQSSWPPLWRPSILPGYAESLWMAGTSPAMTVFGMFAPTDSPPAGC